MTATDQPTLPLRRSLTALALCLAVTGVAAAAAALASASSASFCAQLDRPVWAPPAWLFGPVWSALYLMMAVAAWRVWRVTRSLETRRLALGLYGGQLVLNALWTWLFFEWRLGGLAFVEIMILFALVCATTGQFFRCNRLSGLLLLPYAGWVGFAAALSLACWQANPDLLGGPLY